MTHLLVMSLLVGIGSRPSIFGAEAEGLAYDDGRIARCTRTFDGSSSDIGGSSLWKCVDDISGMQVVDVGTVRIHRDLRCPSTSYGRMDSITANALTGLSEYYENGTPLFVEYSVYLATPSGNCTVTLADIVNLTSDEFVVDATPKRYTVSGFIVEGLPYGVALGSMHDCAAGLLCVQLPQTEVPNFLIDSSALLGDSWMKDENSYYEDNSSNCPLRPGSATEHMTFVRADINTGTMAQSAYTSGVVVTDSVWLANTIGQASVPISAVVTVAAFDGSSAVTYTLPTVTPIRESITMTGTGIQITTLSGFEYCVWGPQIETSYRARTYYPTVH